MKMKTLLGAVAMSALLVACGRNETIQPGPRYSLDSLPSQQGQAEATRSNVALRLNAVQNNSWSQHLGGADHISANAAFSGTPRLVAAIALGANEQSNNALNFLNFSRNQIANAPQPIVANNTIFHYHADGKLYAVNPSGSVYWSRSMVPAGQKQRDVVSGGVAYANGRLFVATGYGEVVAVDAQSGNIAWRYVQNAPLHKPPIVAGGKVIVVSEGSTAIAVNASDGAVAWRYFAQRVNVPARLNAGAPAANASRAVLALSSGAVAEVDLASGNPLWEKTSVTDNFTGSKSLFSEVAGDPVIGGGDIILGTESGVLSLDPASGAIRWKTDIGTKGPLIVNGNAVMGLTPADRVFRLDRGNGAMVFNNKLPEFDSEGLFKSRIRYHDVRLAQNALWVTDDKFGLHRISAQSGGITGQFQLAETFVTTPIFSNGMMIGIGTSGRLLVYR